MVKVSAFKEILNDPPAMNALMIDQIATIH